LGGKLIKKTKRSKGTEEDSFIENYEKCLVEVNYGRRLKDEKLQHTLTHRFAHSCIFQMNFLYKHLPILTQILSESSLFQASSICAHPSRKESEDDY